MEVDSVQAVVQIITGMRWRRFGDLVWRHSQVDKEGEVSV